MSIGIVGHGMVGSAVSTGFTCDKIISDPKLNTISISDLVHKDPEMIFMCLPTPMEDKKFNILNSAIHEILNCNYRGIIVVKSTVLPSYVVDVKNVVYNPEFLTRSTAQHDFNNPEIFVLGGDSVAISSVIKFYKKYSLVDLSTCNIHITTPHQAMFIKYMMNCFFATKVTFMNQMKEVADTLNIDFSEIGGLLKLHPWIGSNHVSVPGPDGKPGFGGPCLPKDCTSFSDYYDVDILKKVLELNLRYRE